MALLSWISIGGLAVGWALFLRPASMGGPAGYVIVSGESMEPMLHTGDLAVVRQQPEYAVGDVVAYRIPKQDVGGGMLVIHRVIGGDADDGYILQGDNRETQDMWRPVRGDIVGSLRWYLPHAGTGLFLLKTPLVIAGVIGFLGFWFVVTSGETTPTSTNEVVRDDTAPATPIEPIGPPLDAAPSRVPKAPRLPAGTAAAAGVVALTVFAAMRQGRAGGVGR